MVCRRHVSALAVLIALLVPAVARAQSRVTSADLEGVVRDETGAVVPGVGITARNVDTAQERTTATDSQGRYLLPGLAPGVYTVTAELFGFGGQTRENVALLLGQAVRVGLDLRMAGVKETITVTETLPVLDPRRTVVAHAVGQSQIHNLPINGRNYISFSLITPGVVPDRAAEPVLDFDANGVVQGFVEGANVNPVLELTKLIMVSRSFESATSAIEQSEKSLEDAIKTLGSV